VGLITSFQRDCKRLHRWVRGTDPRMAKHRSDVGHTYSAGMEPGTWDEAQQQRGLKEARAREIATRKAAAARGAR
jgi:hypothetical protein